MKKSNRRENIDEVGIGKWYDERNKEKRRDER
jgi:hypothetical protein